MDIGVKDGYALSSGGINLIIGGIALTHNTPALIASKFSFSENDIKKMELVNNDVHLQIDIPYTINNSAFFGDTDITFFNDFTNKLNIVQNGAFENSRIRNFTTTSNFYIYGAAFQRSWLQNFEGTNLGRIQRGAFQRCYSLRKLIIPGTVIGLLQNIFFDCSNLVEIDISSLTFTEANAESFNSVAQNGTIKIPIKYQNTPTVNNLIAKNWTINYV